MENNYEQKREVHSNLKVVSILSYVWIGISFLSAAWGIYNGLTMTDEKMEAAVEMYNNLNPGSGDALIDQMKYTVPQSAVAIVLLVISLFGVLMMTKLNRKGLLVYSIGELAGYGTMFFFGGISSITAAFKTFLGESTANAMGYGILAMMIVFDFLFIYLYKNGLDKSNA